jgi:hypothetical protein
MNDLGYLICPENHIIGASRDNFARDDSDEEIDANGRLMFEVGLYCHACNRPYGLSKLRDPEPSIS